MSKATDRKWQVHLRIGVESVGNCADTDILAVGRNSINVPTVELRRADACVGFVQKIGVSAVELGAEQQVECSGFV
ncbi:MAG: hypothetical protein EOO38_26815 [Cytophagaceae bacterium]|nr:MAG: hypothetical protein EOO38_26815 [Cytophagaceae bacterium]